MMKKILILSLSIILLPSLGFSRWTPARSMQELEQEAGEPGREKGPSAVSATSPLELFQTGIEPYLEQEVKYSLTNEEDDTIYSRPAGNATGNTGTGSTEDATER